MSFSVRKTPPSPLELQYAELKKQSVIDQNKNQTKNGLKERQASRVNDEVTLSSAEPEADDPTKRKPSQPVTPDEMQALRTQFSIYA